MIIEIVPRGVGKLHIEFKSTKLKVYTFFKDIELSYSQIKKVYFLKTSNSPESPIPREILPPGVGNYFNNHLLNSQQILIIFQDNSLKVREMMIHLPKSGEVRDQIIIGIQRYLKNKINFQNKTYFQAVKESGVKHNPFVSLAGIIIIFIIACFLMFGWWIIMYLLDNPFEFVEMFR